MPIRDGRTSPSPSIPKRIPSSRYQNLWKNHGDNGFYRAHHPCTEDLAENSMQQKKVKLEEVDTRITDSIQDATALEEEICEAEEYRTVVMEKIAFLQDFISPPRLPSPTSETSDTETMSSNHSNAPMHIMKKQLLHLVYHSLENWRQRV